MKRKGIWASRKMNRYILSSLPEIRAYIIINIMAITERQAFLLSLPTPYISAIRS